MTAQLIIISAPSGTGKTTLCDRLLQDYPELVYSVSCTTRAPRGEEEDGVDYYFRTEEDFKRLLGENAFLEHACVHGNYYGTLASPVRDALSQGLSVLLDIDVEGAAKVRKSIASAPKGDPLGNGTVDIFIAPPSMEALRLRLESRGEDSPETIEKRLRNARGEMDRAPEFKYRIVNDDLEVAYKELKAVLEDCNAVPGPGNPDNG